MKIKVKRSPEGSVAIKYHPNAMDWQVVFRSMTETGSYYPNDYLGEAFVANWVELIDPTQMQLVFIPRTNNDPS